MSTKFFFRTLFVNILHARGMEKKNDRVYTKTRHRYSTHGKERWPQAEDVDSLMCVNITILYYNQALVVIGTYSMVSMYTQ